MFISGYHSWQDTKTRIHLEKDATYTKRTMSKVILKNGLENHERQDEFTFAQVLIFALPLLFSHKNHS